MMLGFLVTVFVIVIVNENFTDWTGHLRCRLVMAVFDFCAFSEKCLQNVYYVSLHVLNMSECAST